MPERTASSRSTRGLLLAALLLIGAGCSSSSELSVMLFADPGKYTYKTCDEINKAAVAVATRQKVLRELIDKAEQGAAGALVGVVAYRGEYRTVSEELVVIEQAARAKNCLTASNWRSRDVIQ